MPENLVPEGKPSGPFGNHAQRYWEMGLPVIPCGGPDGKKPRIKWAAYQKRMPTEQELAFWINRYPTANLGLVTGVLSRVAVIDSDDPARKLDALFERFGETPLVTFTPRGGYHLFYRHAGERNTSPNMEKVDMRGQGGFVILPPSFNPSLGRAYQFVSGGLEDFESLPYRKDAKPESVAVAVTGNRNKSLFNFLIEQAHDAETLDALTEKALAYNAQSCSPPLPSGEITKTAQSVWSYKKKGRLFKKGEQSVMLPMHKLEAVKFAHPRALSMYCDLLACHGNLRDEFAITLAGYGQRSGWDAKTVGDTLRILLDAGLIDKTYKGGRYHGDASLYRFT